jgi:hypothetical protein
MSTQKALSDARILAIQMAFNTKSVVYITEKLQLRQAHNYGGRHIEKAVYKDNVVNVYDKDGKSVRKQEGKKSTKKGKGTSKLSNATDEKSS